MSDVLISTFPLAIVRKVRADHQLPYINNRAYDYTFASNAKVVPWCLNHWARHGLQLDDDLVQQVWQQMAEKRAGNTEGELGRAAKLVLDAFRGVYDMAATAEFSGLQVCYSSDADMNGLDVLLMMKPKPTWVQFSVSASGKGDYYAAQKHLRRRRRGQIEAPVVRLEAGWSDLDRDHQPYVANDHWYAQVHNAVVRQLLGDWW